MDKEAKATNDKEGKSIPLDEAIEKTPETTTTNADDKAETGQWRDVEEVKKIIRARDEAKKQARELAGRLAEIEAREAERQRKDEESRQAAEREKLEQQGQYQQALESFKKDSGAKLDDYRKRVGDRLVPNAISAAVARIGNVSPEVAGDLPRLLSDRVRLNHDTLEIEVLGDDGKQALDGDLKPVTVEAFVGEFVKSRPYMLLDKQAAGTGLRPGKLSGEVGDDFERALKDPAYAEAWRKRDPEGYQKAEDGHFTRDRILAKARKVSGMD